MRFEMGRSLIHNQAEQNKTRNASPIPRKKLALSNSRMDSPHRDRIVSAPSRNTAESSVQT